MNKAREERLHKKKLHKIWAEAVKLKFDNRCVLCGETKRLNAHHIIPKEVDDTRYDVDNGIALCPKHHKFGKYSAHRNGFWFTLWLEEHYPCQYELLKEKIYKWVIV